MEAQKQAEITGKAESFTQTELLRELVAGIDRHVLTGAPEYFYLRDESALAVFCSLLGIDRITSDRILAYEYSATSTENLERSHDSYTYSGVASVEEVLARIGDFGMSLEFPNNFTIRLAVLLDAETVVRIEQDVNESVVLCQACVEEGDEDTLRNFEDGYGCGHADEILHVRNSASIHPYVPGVNVLPPEW